MNNYNEIAFVFSPRYRLLRHFVFWVFQVLFFTLMWFHVTGLGKGLILSLIWIPVWMLYCYPLMYWIIPKYLLRGNYRSFTLMAFLWIIIGYIFKYVFLLYVLNPIMDAMQLKGGRNPWAPGVFLAMTTTAGIACLIVLFKYWVKKQQDWLQAEKEKVTAELQLLKAQVHPHFLFNTLNNIYSFSLENSPKTPQLILKLSSLLNYILYDCKADEVLLEKEINVMRDYIGLEKERYGNKLEISINVEGDVKDKFIAPLLLLPFLENAFKHGTSEQLEKPWLSMDISVKENILRCKIVNSKNEDVMLRENGIGIMNVKKRLAFLYPGMHELKIDNEADFFVVSLLLQFKGPAKPIGITKQKKYVTESIIHETSLPVS